MEENIEMQEVEQTSDAFLDGFDGTDTTLAEADQPEQEEVEEASEEVEQTEETTAEEVDTEVEETQPVAEPEKPVEAVVAPKKYALKHMDDPVKEYTAEEMIPLAQMGLDYKRVREELDKAKPIMKIWEAAAKQHDMSVEDYTKSVRRGLIEAEGASPELASRLVAMEDSAYSEPVQDFAPAEVETTANEQDDRSTREVNEFKRYYPNVKEVPQEVWNEVINNGVNLTLAYSQYQTSLANAKIAEMEKEKASSVKNAETAARSTGSMRSAGAEKKSKDPFLDGWDD